MQMLLSIGCKPYHYQVAKSSISNEAEFLDPSLKTSPCTKTSRVSCENQSFFLFMWKPVFFLVHVKTSLFSCYFEMLPPLSKVIVFFCYFLRYDEVFLISLLNGCYHYLVFMHPVNGCSKSKLLVKVNFIKK